MNPSSGPSLPSERSFGGLFCAIFIALAGYGWLIGKWSSAIVLGCLIAGCAIGLVAVVAPFLLRPVNWVWFQLGQLLGKIVSPIVLGAIFFLLLTPVSLVSRLFGRDELRSKRKAQQQSYGIDRAPPGPEPTSFKNQF